MERIEDLELHQNLPLQKKLWKAQRVSLIAWGLLCVTALSGLLGSPLQQAVLRGGLVYFFLLAVFALAGKRSLADVNTFDIVLLLVISEAIQPIFEVEEMKIRSSLLLVLTLVTLELVTSHFKKRHMKLGQWLDEGPVVLVKDGKPYPDRMRSAQVDDSDILNAARENGLTKLEDIKFAILEPGGDISIIPKEEEKAA